jgi:hypothetical protein
VKSLRAKAVKHLSAPKSTVHAQVEDPIDQEQLEAEVDALIQLKCSNLNAHQPTTGILTKKEKRLFKREAFQECKLLPLIYINF